MMRFATAGYSFPLFSIEYVWINWEHCNEVENASETILLRGVLEAAGRAAG